VPVPYPVLVENEITEFPFEFRFKNKKKLPGEFSQDFEEKFRNKKCIGGTVIDDSKIC
jgi:hypothetical protein